jgi:hypothetical protein
MPRIGILSSVKSLISWCIGLAVGLCSLSALPAQDTPAAAIRGVEKFDISTGGTGFYRPQKWGMVKLSVRNPQPHEVQLLAVSHFVDDPTLQFGRHLWLPAHSRLTSWHPILMPAIANEEQKFFELQTLVMSSAGGDETLAMNDVGSMQFEQSMRVSSSEPMTALFGTPSQEGGESRLWAASIDLLLTARYERGLKGNLAILGNDLLAPAGEETLDALDHLVIANDRMLADAAGLGAIRRWVAGGGSLWVMADQVAPELLEALLGDEADITVVDRIDLTHVKVVPAPRATATAPFERDLDRPAPMVRIMAENVEPAFFVDGWPAAFWKSYGEGRVLVTTLGANGWVRPRQPDDPVLTSGGNFKTGFFASEPLNNLSVSFFTKHPAPALPVQVAEEQVQQLIGYTVPTRGIILGTLMGFTALIGVSAVWLSRKGRLEWFGVATPIIALTAAGILSVTGMSARSNVSDGSAVVQLVEAVPGTDDVRVEGMSGFFSSGEEPLTPLSGSQGGWMMPEMSAMGGSTRRLVWSDIDRWAWEILPQKPGLRTVRTQSSGPVATPLSAAAGFPAGKLAGNVVLPAGIQPSDAILATRSGRIGLTMTSDGQWTAAGDSELGEGQFLSASVLSDEQQRRSRLMSAMFTETAGRSISPLPTLYVWTNPWVTDSQNHPDVASGQIPHFAGSALVAIPVSWQAPEVGTEFTLPGPLLTYHEVQGPDGSRPSGLFDARAHQWVERTGATAGWVAFDIPPAILPLEAKSLEVTFRVLGLMGRLELSGFKNGAVQSIKVWNNPVGTQTWTIDDPSLIPIDGAGRFMFRVDAGVANVDSPTEVETGKRDASDSSTREQSGDTKKEIVTSAPVNYWQFEEISARITVTVPHPDTATAATP